MICSLHISGQFFYLVGASSCWWWTIEYSQNYSSSHGKARSNHFCTTEKLASLCSPRQEWSIIPIQFEHGCRFGSMKTERRLQTSSRTHHGCLNRQTPRLSFQRSMTYACTSLFSYLVPHRDTTACQKGCRWKHYLKLFHDHALRSTWFNDHVCWRSGRNHCSRATEVMCVELLVAGFCS